MKVGRGGGGAEEGRWAKRGERVGGWEGVEVREEVRKKER